MVKLNRQRKNIDTYVESENADTYVNSENTENEMRDTKPKSNIVKYGLILGVIVAIIVAALFIRQTTKPKTEQPKVEQTEQKEKEQKEKPVVMPKEATNTQPIKDTNKDEKSARESLERGDAPLTQKESSDIANRISQAMEKIKDPKTIKNDNESGLFLTSANSLDVLKQVLLQGYKPDTNSVRSYYSDNDNVWQFTVNFTKDGANPVTFTGNYSPTMEQLGFVQLHGELPNGASQDNSTPQFDKAKADAESDKPVNPDGIK